jgi:hypothetical protein
MGPSMLKLKFKKIDNFEIYIKKKKTHAMIIHIICMYLVIKL